MTNLEIVQNSLRPVLALHMAWDRSTADGKVDWGDLPHAMTVFTTMQPFATSAPQFVPAFTALSDDEAEFEKLKQWVSQEYDIADDVLEAKIEKGVQVVLDLADFIFDLGLVGEEKEED